jgi:5-methylcytosine-specific restriction protein B
MTKTELLRKFEEYASQRVTSSAANSYKNSIKGTLEYFGYGEDILPTDIAEIKKEHENLRSDFENNIQQTEEKLKSFYTGESYLKNGFVSASLQYFIPFIESLENAEEKKISNAAFLQWFGPLIKALKDLGGSATPDDACKQIIKNENLSDDIINATRGKHDRKKFNHEVAFARNYLAYEGIIDKTERGRWTLTEKGKNTTMTRELASEIFRKWVDILKERRENVADSEITERGAREKHYWLYAPGRNASKWDEFHEQNIMGIGWDRVGDLTSYSSREAIRTKMKELLDETKSYNNDSLALWQFFHDIQEGDIIFAKKGIRQIIGRGIVESEYMFMPERDEYKNIRKIKWTHKGNWLNPDGQAVIKTLTDITSYTDYVQKLELLIAGDSDTDESESEDEIIYDKYSKDVFLDEVFMEAKQYETLVRRLRDKKNLILQGAPGVGKTFAAKRLAYSIIGEKDTKRVMVVQFHQSYSYEDFIMGFRPTKEGGFELVKGPFYTFCKEAQDNPERDYFFIIDEINRGNLSKIFGELLMLIENDKRGEELQLLYKNELFSAPENVYIIGLMNTADRSLALIDYALRRRFSFHEMEPGFDSKGFKDVIDRVKHAKFKTLIDRVKELNEDIFQDDSLGKGFRIGHSYFCPDGEITDHDQWLADVVEFDILPLLNEYWFDNKTKIVEWTNKLRGVLNG